MIFISLVTISLITTTGLSAGVVDWSSSMQVHEGRYLFATVQDNGHSCVYSKRYKAVLVTCEGCARPDEPKLPPIYSDEVPLKDVLDSSESATSIVARSIAIDDVIATLQERYDNDRKYSGLFELAQGTLAGKYAIYRGTRRYYRLMELIGEKKPRSYPRIKCMILCVDPGFCPPCAGGPKHGEQRDGGTRFLDVIAKVAKETHSSGSVSCPSQP